MASTNSSVKKYNEDPRLRPFISTLFDSQNYIRSVIKDGRSEQCFNDIVSCMAEIDVEIQGFISLHKDDLMSGMQDVATLAERYTNLSTMANKLHSNITRMKKEVSDVHSLVEARTSELERIHECGKLIQQIKQFVQLKNQLDLYLNNNDDKNFRDISNAAKIIHELENFLQNPKLLEIKLIEQHVGNIKLFGLKIRMLGQEKLLLAIQEKNQAMIANYLQVFYNLSTLPDIIVMIIDTIVKDTADMTKDILDLDSFIPMVDTNLPTASIPTSLSATKRSSMTSTGSTVNASTSMSMSQLKIAMNDISQQWSTILHDKAMVVHVLQRVVIKKEDPTSNEKFFDVLTRYARGMNISDAASGNPSSEGVHESFQFTTKRYLAKGDLLDLFWYRLSLLLQDVSNEKLRSAPNVTNLIYPSLRKALVNVFHHVNQQTHNYNEEKNRTVLDIFNADFAAIMGSHYYLRDRRDMTSLELQIDNYGIFGSLCWSQNDLLASSGIGRRKIVSNRWNQIHEDEGGNVNESSKLLHYQSRYDDDHHHSVHHQEEEEEDGLYETHEDENGSMESKSSSSSSRHQRGVWSIEKQLIQGLKPIADRYLINALSRMTAPVLQMFPELEGYTAAIPSKRDLQTFVKAVQAELVLTITDSEIGLVYAICKECVKVVRIMLSKIEGMIINSLETRKVSSINNFARNNQQEHNGQLVTLLVQLKESLERIPGQVIKNVGSDESYPNTLTDDRNKLKDPQYQDEIKSLISGMVVKAVHLIDELMVRQIVEPIVSLLSGYIRSILISLSKEGVMQSTLTQKTVTVGGGSSSEEMGNLQSSLAIQTLSKQWPVMLKNHLQCLPKSFAVQWALEEICLRTMSIYVSITSLLRPMNEQTRLRTAKDMSVLDVLFASVLTNPMPSNCPVVLEYKAFRRFLFFQDEFSGPNKNTQSNAIHSPNIKDVLSPPYISQLRPSTVMGYIMACGPNQLPLPYEVSTDHSLQSYLEILSDITGELMIIDNKPPPSYAIQWKKIFPFVTSSVRFLYVEENHMKYWKLIENEMKSWDLIQKALDIFFQRISVVEGVALKQSMRSWYDVVMDIGSQYYGK